jgi:hypothetical protein
VGKKIKKSIKLRKLKKNNQKNQIVKQKPIRIFKKTDKFGYGFTNLKPKNQTEINNRAKLEKNQAKQEKTKPNRKNLSQTGKNRVKPKKPSQLVGFRFLL